MSRQGRREFLRLPPPKVRDYETLMELQRYMRLEHAGEEGDDPEIERIFSRVLRLLTDLEVELSQLESLIVQEERDIAKKGFWLSLVREHGKASVRRLDDALFKEKRWPVSGKVPSLDSLPRERVWESTRRLIPLYREMNDSLSLVDAATFDLERHRSDRQRGLNLLFLRKLLGEAIQAFLESDEK